MSLFQQFRQLDTAWASVFPAFSESFQIGPFVVNICGSSPSFKKLTRAFYHLKKSNLEQSPDFTICLWDASTSKNCLPPLNWNWISSIHPTGYNDSCLYMHWFRCIDAVSVIHTEENKAYYIVRNANQLPWWVEGSPFQVILHTWLQEKGFQLTHTAIVGNETQSVLLAGKGGSGKSTTTLVCLESGLNSLGEDYCILTPNEPALGFSVYNSAKWTSHTRELFTQYEQWIQNPLEAEREKALVFYQDIYPKQMKISLPLRSAIAVSVGDKKDPILETSDSLHTLQNIMMSTVKQLPFCSAKTMRTFKKIIEPLKHYRLVLGRDMQANVQVIQELLIS